MKKSNNVKLQSVSLIFFIIYFIGSFFSWFSVPGLKSIHGTLVFSSLFPIGILSVLLFIMLNVISIVKLNKMYMHIINVLLLIIISLLSIRLLINWGGFSEYICPAFYISNISIIFSLIFYIINIFSLNKNQVI